MAGAGGKGDHLSREEKKVNVCPKDSKAKVTTSAAAGSPQLAAHRKQYT